MKGAVPKGLPIALKIALIIGSMLALIGTLYLLIFSEILGGNTPKPEPTPQATWAPPTSLEVLIPNQNIDEGTELKAELFRKDSRPIADFIGVGVISNVGQLSGAYAKSFIAAGQPLVSDHLTFRAPVNTVVPRIRDGYRAITIKLDRQVTNEGWARAGVRVDVLWIWRQGATGLPNANQASVIVQNVRVLSSGTSVSSDFGGESKMILNGESTVTLEVTAEDQKRIKLASGKGELRLLLRGDEDTAELSDRGRQTVEQLLNDTIDKTNKPPGANDQGWVIIDGRRYRLVGATLVPG